MKRIDRIVTGCAVAAVFVLGCGTEDDADPDGETPAPTDPPDPGVAPTSCAGESDCAAGLSCTAGSCRPCTGHGQCQSDVCDQDAATVLGRGACVPEARVIYVDVGTSPVCQTGDGSRAHPVCQIRDAIPLVAGDKDTVRVYSGWYFPFGASGLTVRVFGPGDGTAIVGEEDLGAAVRITNGARVLLDGLDFGVAVRNGVNCAASNLKVVRGSAHGDLSGILAADCTLAIDRMRVGGLLRSGITITGTGDYSITNSYIKGGDLQAVVFSGAGGGVFRFNTVRGGGEISPGGIDCGTSARIIQDSIVVESFPAAGGAQTVGACMHQRVVVGSGDTRSDRGLIKVDPALDPDGRLLDTPASAACCIDQGPRVVPGVTRDFFGTLRPQGPRYDLGAHELVRAGAR